MVHILDDQTLSSGLHRKEIKISLCTCAERCTLGIKIKALGHLS
jgi:hypothetical protein